MLTVARPNLISHMSRAKQTEAKINLKAAYSNARIYYQNNGTYDVMFVNTGFMPDGTMRYTYVSGAKKSTTVDPKGNSNGKGKGVNCQGGGQSANKNPHCTSKSTPGDDDVLFCSDSSCDGQYTSTIDSCGAGAGVGVVGAKVFCYVAYSNLDGDPAMDVWTINHMGALNNGGQYECTGAFQTGGYCNTSGKAVAGNDAVYDLN
jgi:hypothetical protein